MLNIGSIHRAIPVLKSQPFATDPIVGDLWLLVHLTSDPVTHVLLDNAVSVGVSDLSNGCSHITETISLTHLSDPGPHRLSSAVDQVLGFGSDLADRHCEGSITVEPLVDGPGINGEDVAFLQSVIRRYPVNDHIVG